MEIIGKTEIDSLTSYPELIDDLEKAFSDSRIHVPQRQHLKFNHKPDGRSDTLLSMPVWEDNLDIGVKYVTIHPGNKSYQLPTVQGVFVLSDALNGEIKALLDAASLTTKRTAATSALVSKYLSRPDSNRFLMVGTGALSKELIRAHSVTRTFSEINIWGRNKERTLKVIAEIPEIDVKWCEDLRSVVPGMDIISCATMSIDPVFDGNLVGAGTHIDLVGSYKTDMRESDDTLISRSSIFVDTRKGACRESGDIVIPLNKGIISLTDIRADIFELCKGSHPGRENNSEITLFKSVGYALEDLVAARYYYRKLFEH